MSFYDFAVDFIGDDTPLGTLALSITLDKDFPRNETNHQRLSDYFYGTYIDHELLEIANRALSLYLYNKAVEF